ncbi:MAG TPA: hypothetical protein VFC39_09690 [Acidobacteriaceae bacterium]|nr:hypothetical protein [Acidobacteriaceae bacterium]
MYRRTGILSMIAVSLFLFCGQTAPVACNQSQQQIGPSKGEVIGVGVAAVGVIVIGTVVLVHVHNSHHTIKGCVIAGPAGVQIQSGTGSDMKTYTLSGDTNVKVGDLVKVHGSKVKKVKNSTGDQTFMIEKLNKDYGPCTATP